MSTECVRKILEILFKTLDLSTIVTLTRRERIVIVVNKVWSLGKRTEGSGSWVSWNRREKVIRAQTVAIKSTKRGKVW